MPMRIPPFPVSRLRVEHTPVTTDLQMLMARARSAGSHDGQNDCYTLQFHTQAVSLRLGADLHLKEKR